MTKTFCPHCGNKTLKKISVTINEDGSTQMHFSRNPKVLNPKGLKVRVEDLTLRVEDLTLTLRVEDLTLDHTRWNAVEYASKLTQIVSNLVDYKQTSDHLKDSQQKTSSCYFCIFT